MSGDVTLPAHALIRVVDASGRRIEVTPCMLQRLDDDEYENGRVPADVPEYDVPVGSECHGGWRDGCPHTDAGEQTSVGEWA